MVEGRKVLQLVESLTLNPISLIMEEKLHQVCFSYERSHWQNRNIGWKGWAMASDSVKTPEQIMRKVLADCADCDTCRFLMDESCLFFPQVAKAAVTVLKKSEQFLFVIFMTPTAKRLMWTLSKRGIVSHDS